MFFYCIYWCDYFNWIVFFSVLQRQTHVVMHGVTSRVSEKDTAVVHVFQSVLPHEGVHQTKWEMSGSAWCDSVTEPQDLEAAHTLGLLVCEQTKLLCKNTHIQLCKKMHTHLWTWIPAAVTHTYSIAFWVYINADDDSRSVWSESFHESIKKRKKRMMRENKQEKTADSYFFCLIREAHPHKRKPLRGIYKVCSVINDHILGRLIQRK